MVTHVLGALQSREIPANVKPFLIGGVMIDANQLIPVSILRVLTHCVVVGPVDCPNLVGSIPEVSDLRGNRIDHAGGNDVARQRRPAELSI